MRKPLLVQGARQVGKTWLIKEFGRNEYDDIAYFNFEQSPELADLFNGELLPGTIVESLGALRGRKIEPEKSLIVFDEIQNAPRALTSMKYFCENAPEYHLVGAGSLLGVAVGRDNNFPVGKVEFLSLYPLTFTEYLWARGEELLARYLFPQQTVSPLPEALHAKAMRHFRFYLFLGGMPEVVGNYIKRRDPLIARETQKAILLAYQRDFAKHTTKSEAMRVYDIWRSLPAQLARENRKFKYSDAKKGGRAAQFESAIAWLESAGLVHVARQVSKPGIPLTGFADASRFKLYLADPGLLGALVDLPSRLAVTGDSIISEYNGAISENYVACALVARAGKGLFYWSSAHRAEVDFVMQHDGGLYPLEVKSGRSRHARSLRAYAEQYSPPLVTRISARNFTLDGNFLNLPLYAADNVVGWMELAEGLLNDG